MKQNQYFNLQIDIVGLSIDNYNSDLFGVWKIFLAKIEPKNYFFKNLINKTFASRQVWYYNKPHQPPPPNTSGWLYCPKSFSWLKLQDIIYFLSPLYCLAKNVSFVDDFQWTLVRIYNNFLEKIVKYVHKQLTDE